MLPKAAFEDSARVLREILPQAPGLLPPLFAAWGLVHG
jgi:hypothetical protein